MLETIGGTVRIRVLCGVVASLLFFLLGPVTSADAATGPPRLQRLAQAQTRQLFRYYVEGGTASPASCAQARTVRDRGHAVLLLPTLLLGQGDVILTCRTKARWVLVDLGGAAPSEDATGNTYTTADGRELPFTRANLEDIGDDALVQYFTAQAPATLDGVAITGTQVSTAPVTSRVTRRSGQFYRDSEALGHPGQLATAYCGWKALVKLTPGHHEIKVDLSGITGSPTHFTYDIDVRRSHSHH